MHHISRTHSRFIAGVVTLAIMALSLGALHSSAQASEVKVTSQTLKLVDPEDGTVAFGSGEPIVTTEGGEIDDLEGNGTVEFFYTTDDTAPFNQALVARARVTGTLYVQPNSGNVAGLTIQFKDHNGGVLATRNISLPGSGESVFDAANQLAIDEGFSSSNLESVTISISGTFLSPAISASRSARIDAALRTIINNGSADFGSGPHAGGTPTQSALVRFHRENGIMQGLVDGTLSWNGPGPGTARLFIDYQTLGGVTLVTHGPFDVSGPGGDPNHPANQRTISDSFVTSGSVWQIRLRVGVAGPFAGFAVGTATSRTFVFPGATGLSEVTLSESTVAIGERLDIAFNWTVPDGNWHDLDFLLLRIRDGDHTVFLLFFDEATQKFSVLDPWTRRLRGGFTAGSHHRLDTLGATLHLKDSSVVGSGPTGPSVALNLAFSFKIWTLGQRLTVETAARNDDGEYSPFEEVGSLKVTGKPWWR